MSKKVTKNVLVGLLSFATVLSSGMAFAKWNNAGVVSAAGETKTVSDIISASNENWTTTYNVSEKEMKSDLRSNTKGVAFVSKGTGVDATNKPISVVEELSGTFEMDFRVWSDVTFNTTDYTTGFSGDTGWTSHTSADVRMMSITIKDLDANQEFSVYLRQGNPWASIVLNASVGYGGSWGAGRFYSSSGTTDNCEVTTYTKYKASGFFGTAGTYTTYNTKLWGPTFCNAGYANTSESYQGNNPLLIGFNPTTKEVYGRQCDRWGRTDTTANGPIAATDGTYRIRTIADLDNDTDLSYVGDANKVLKDCKFDRYSVSINFMDVVAGKTAKIHISSINGQNLGGADGVLTSTANAVAVGGQTFNTQETTGVVNVPAPKLSSLAEKAPTYNGNVKVLDSEGNVVLAETAWKDDLTFTASKSDTYQVVYGNGTYTRKNCYHSTKSGSDTTATVGAATCELPVVVTDAKAGGASLTLDGKIGLNYYFELADSLVASDSQAKVVFMDKNQNQLGEEISLANYQAVVSGENAGKYKFTYPVAAKDYKQEISAVVFDGNGDIVVGIKYSVKAYADAINDMDDATAGVPELKAIVNSMITYCEASRAYFAGETVATVDGDFENVETFAPTVEKAENSEMDYPDISVSLLLKSGTEIRVYYKGEQTCTVNGEAVTGVAANEDGYYFVTVPNVSANALDTVQTVVIGDYTVKYSAMSYVYGVLSYTDADANLVNLVKALYNYNQAANAYFG